MTTCQLKIKSLITRTSLVVQWLRLYTSTTRGMGSIPGQGRSHIPCACVYAKLLQLCPTLCDPKDCVAHKAPQSMRFSRQKYWCGLWFPPPGDLPNPGIEPTSLMFPALAGRFFTTEPQVQPKNLITKDRKSVSRAVLFNWGPCCPPGDIQQSSEIFLFVPTGRGATGNQ